MMTESNSTAVETTTENPLKDEDVALDAIAFQLLKDDLNFFCGYLCTDFNASKAPEAFDEMVSEVCQFGDACPPAAEEADSEKEKEYDSSCQGTIEKCTSDYEEMCRPLDTFQYADCATPGESKDEVHKKAIDLRKHLEHKSQALPQINVEEEDGLLTDLDMNLEMLGSDFEDKAVGETKDSDSPERKMQRKSRLDDTTLDALSQMLSQIPSDFVKAQTFHAAPRSSSPPNPKPQHHLQHPKSARVKRRYHKQKKQNHDNENEEKAESKDDEESANKQQNYSALMEDLSIIPLTGTKLLNNSIDDSCDTAGLEIFDFHKLATDLSNSEFVKTMSSSKNAWTPPSWPTSAEDNKQLSGGGGGGGGKTQKVRFQQDNDKAIPEYPRVINVKNRARSFPARYHSDEASVDTHPDDETAGGGGGKDGVTDPIFSSEKDKKRFWRLQLARKIIGRRSKSMLLHNSVAKKSGSKKQKECMIDEVFVEEDGSIQVSLYR